MTKSKKGVMIAPECKNENCYIEAAMNDGYDMAKKSKASFDATNDIKQGQFSISAYRMMLSSIRTHRNVNKHLINYLP